MKQRVPFREGLFTERDGGGLLGNKCKSCGRVFFPKAMYCLDCFSQDMEELILSKTGKLYTFTIVRMPAEHFEPPYAIGLIELPEGIRVFSQIDGWQEQSLKIGVEMELVIRKLWEEEEREMIGYAFRPLTKGNSPQKITHM